MDRDNGPFLLEYCLLTAITERLPKRRMLSVMFTYDLARSRIQIYPRAALFRRRFTIAPGVTTERGRKRPLLSLGRVLENVKSLLLFCSDRVAHRTFPGS